MAHVITSDREVIEIAQELAHELAKEAAQRDRQRQLPYAEIEKLSASGLFDITVPKEYRGA
jgi:alkylation response protein AidB-like acyl-CoA dehydrogenase